MRSVLGRTLVWCAVVMASVAGLYGGGVEAFDVPGNIVLFPFICEASAPPVVTARLGRLNSTFTVAETAGHDEAVETAGLTQRSGEAMIFNSDGLLVRTFPVTWTLFDVITQNCISLVGQMSNAQRSQLRVTITGTDYYFGYIVYSVTDGVSNRPLIGWGNLDDGIRGTDAGFNGVPLESTIPLQRLNPQLLPRYRILAGTPGNFTWWIIHTGNSAPSGCRILNGFICNEEEDCISQVIPIPKAMNIIDIAPLLPPFLFTAFPKAGFAMWEVSIANTTACSNVVAGDVFGWSYQRKNTLLRGPSAVIFPIHMRFSLPEPQ